jgi:hypothetical protein
MNSIVETSTNSCTQCSQDSSEPTCCTKIEIQYNEERCDKDCETSVKGIIVRGYDFGTDDSFAQFAGAASGIYSYA